MRILMLFACRKENVFERSRDKETAQPLCSMGTTIPYRTIHLPCFWTHISVHSFWAHCCCFFLSRCSFCFIDFIMYSRNWSETMRINANLLRMCMHKRNLSIHCVQVILLLATKEKKFNWNYFAFKESTPPPPTFPHARFECVRILLPDEDACREKYLFVPIRYSNYILHLK